MIRLCVPLEDVTGLLDVVGHQTFRDARPNYWRAAAGNDGHAWCTGKSFCWLYCWACNGMNAPAAMHQSRDALNRLFCCYVQGGNFYNAFNSEPNHEWALDRRTRPHDDPIVENELVQRAPYLTIGPLPPPPPPPPVQAPQALILSVVQLTKQFGQVILYGPPGTGKTRLARRAALELLRPESVCRRIPCPACNQSVRLNEQNANQVVLCRRNGCGGQIQMPSEVSEETVEAALSELRRENHFDLVVFHPSYEYEQFIGGIVAKTTDNNRELTYSSEPGKFLNLCLKAQTQTIDQKIVLVIDEINRGNLPKLLGELIYALEYRGTREADGAETHAVTLPFRYTSRFDNTERQTIVVPKNVYIVATMNSSDRSIGHIDAAVRRRFPQMLIEPDVAVVQRAWANVDTPRRGQDLAALMSDINQELARDGELGNEIGVGHSYFLCDPNVVEANGQPNFRAQMIRRWKYQIAPLLNEYRNITSLEQATINQYKERLEGILRGNA